MSERSACFSHEGSQPREQEVTQSVSSSASQNIFYSEGSVSRAKRNEKHSLQITAPTEESINEWSKERSVSDGEVA